MQGDDAVAAGLALEGEVVVAVLGKWTEIGSSPVVTAVAKINGKIGFVVVVNGKGESIG